MTNSSISLDGIDKALSGLGYTNRNTLKYRFIKTIRTYYTSADARGREQGIPPVELIAAIWDTGMDADLIRSKIKNLNSIKSSVNKDLIRGFRKGTNPEGIIVGPDYLFVMSDDAKDRFIGSFSRALMSGAPASMDQIAEISKRFGEFLTKIPDGDVLTFLDTLIDSLDSNRPLPPDKIPEMLRMFGRLLSDIPEHTLLTEKDKISALVELLSENTERQPVETFPHPEDTDAQEAPPPETLDIIDVLGDDAEDTDSDDMDALDEDDGMGVLVEMDEEELEAADSEPDDDLDEDDFEVVQPDADLLESDIDDLDAEAPDADVEASPDVEDVMDVVIDATVDGTDAKENAGTLAAVDEEALEEADLEDESFDEDEFEEVPDDALGHVDAEAVVVEELDEIAADEDEVLSDPERKRLLAERFDRYLGQMERHYNQYLRVPKGEYMVGDPNDRGNEHPFQKVTLPDIFFGKYPVTNALFEVFAERTGYKTTAEKCGFGIVFQGRFQKKKDEQTGQPCYVWNATSYWEKREGAFWYQPNGPGSTLHRKRNHPVVQVSYRDALAFSSWVGKRLPTEAEWEAAAGTAAGNVFPWGNDWKEGLANTEESEISDTVPVDHSPGAKNAFGISDLLGNTLEWTMDRWTPPHGPETAVEHHIVKGGSWISNRDIRLYHRSKYPIDFTSNILGFRCLAD